MSEQWSPDQLIEYAGRVAQAWITTEIDLGELLPPPLAAASPHCAFIKAYQLKSARAGEAPCPPAFSQYRQVCITTFAAPAGYEPRHFNLYMWEDRSWASRAGGVPPWNKKQADIELTWLFPVEDRLLDAGDDRAFVAEVSISGRTVLQLVADLDGTERIDPPALNGFYCADGTGAVWEVPLRESFLGEPRHGQATLTLGTARPGDGGGMGWYVDDLGAVDVEGVVVQDVYFSRVYSDLRLLESSGTRNGP